MRQVIGWVISGLVKGVRTLSFSSDGIKKRRRERLKALRQKRMEQMKTSWENEQDMMYSSFFEEAEPDEWHAKDGDMHSGRGHSWLRVVLSVLLLLLVYMMFQVDTPMAREAQDYVKQALQQDFDFQRAASWYQNRFGDKPGILPALTRREASSEITPIIEQELVRPVQGEVIASFQDRHQWLTLGTGKTARVKAVAEGWVTFAGKAEQTGWTVVIRHREQMESWYGNLGRLTVEKGDWVYPGDIIGLVSSDKDHKRGTFNFTMKYENRFIDPAGVITFD